MGQNVRASDITDGLSQTAAFAERLAPEEVWFSGQPDSQLRQGHPGRDPWFTETAHTSQGEESLAARECQNHRTTVALQVVGLVTPSVRDVGHGYDHLLPPNHAACINGPLSSNPQYDKSLVPASSLHSGGVNVLFADGSVHFIADSVDLNAWRGLGSRDENEVFSF